jgi:hypothetical protein
MSFIFGAKQKENIWYQKFTYLPTKVGETMDGRSIYAFFEMIEYRLLSSDRVESRLPGSQQSAVITIGS